MHLTVPNQALLALTLFGAVLAFPLTLILIIYSLWRYRQHTAPNRQQDQQAEQTSTRAAIGDEDKHHQDTRHSEDMALTTLSPNPNSPSSTSPLQAATAKPASSPLLFRGGTAYNQGSKSSADSSTCTVSSALASERLIQYCIF